MHHNISDSWSGALYYWIPDFSARLSGCSQNIFDFLNKGAVAKKPLNCCSIGSSQWCDWVLSRFLLCDTSVSTTHFRSFHWRQIFFISEWLCKVC
jgi:hypothetical protein